MSLPACDGARTSHTISTHAIEMRARPVSSPHRFAHSQATAGLQVGDVVQKIGGVSVTTSLDAAARMRESMGSVSLAVLRPNPKSNSLSSTDTSETSAAAAPVSLALPTMSKKAPAPQPRAALPTRLEPEELDICAAIKACLSRLFQPQVPLPPHHPCPRRRDGHTSRPAQEHEAAEMIQALWRGKVDRIAISERRAASKELQRLTRGRASRVEARSVRERTNAATVVAAQVRGFIDRQWVQMLRAEEVRSRFRTHTTYAARDARAGQRRVAVATCDHATQVRRRDALVAESDYVQRTSRSHKVKRAFSFTRKQQKHKPQNNGGPSTPSTPAGGRPTFSLQLPGSAAPQTPASSRPAASPRSTPRGSSIKRSFSWGRKVKEVSA